MIFHEFVSQKPASPDPTDVDAPIWNAAHRIEAGTITLPMLAGFAASQRVLGRSSDGPGPAEEVTASTLLDWVTRTNGVLLTRGPGGWGPLSNVTTEGGDLVLAERASVAAPVNGTKVLNASSAGRQMLASLGPTGGRSIAQPFLAQRGIAMWLPRGAGSVVDCIGANTPQVKGAVSGRNPGNTSAATGIKRIGYVSQTAAGSVVGIRNTAAQYWRGNVAGAGGFHIVIRFMVSDPTAVPTARMFVGMQGSTDEPRDVDPSSLTDLIGVGTDAGDTTLQIYAAGSAAQPRTALGANFPATTSSTDFYELTLYCPPAATSVTCQVTRPNTGDVASSVISAPANLPVGSKFLTQQLWRSNGSTPSAVAFDLISFYAETEI